MPNIKISEMPDANALDGSEVVPILQDGVNKKTGLSIFSPVLAADLTVNVGAGGTVGGAYTGEVFLKGATLESVLRAILSKEIHPTYTPPTVSLFTNDNNLVRESGTVINPSLSYTFSQNDAGNLSGVSLLKNGTSISTTMPYTDNSVTVVDGNTTYNLTATYAQGPVKNDNLGNPDATGQINAGSVTSNNITYIGERQFFWGVSASAPTTSDLVRNGATGSMLNNGSSGNTFTITIPINSIMVWFAIPASLSDPASVQYVEYSFSEVFPLFTKTNVNVAGINNYSPINYKLFAYTPLEPFQATIHYKVILS